MVDIVRKILVALMAIIALSMLIGMVIAPWTASPSNMAYYNCQMGSCGCESNWVLPWESASVDFDFDGFDDAYHAFKGWRIWGEGWWWRSGSGYPSGTMDIKYSISHDGKTDYFKVNYDWYTSGGKDYKEKFSVYCKPSIQDEQKIFSNIYTQEWDDDQETFLPRHTFYFKFRRDNSDESCYGEVVVNKIYECGGGICTQTIWSAGPLTFSTFDSINSATTCEVEVDCYTGTGSCGIKYFMWTGMKERMLADIVMEGSSTYKVDYYDMAALGAAYGSSEGDPNWNPECDLDDDGTVTWMDNAILGARYGKKLE